MTQHLANILKDKLDGLVFIDRISGLVIVGEKAQPTEIEGAFAVSKFPISVDADYEECYRTGCFKDMVPNSALKGILYFEDFGTTPKGIDHGSFVYTSKLRLVCWLNHKMIQSGDCHNINHIAINQIRKRLEVGYFNSADLSKIKVTATSVLENDYRLFDRYTYPGEFVKYLMFPYGAFGIDLMCDYQVNSCLPDIELNPETCGS